MTIRVKHKGEYINYYQCKDCGKVMDTNRTMRPNNKFCDPRCMEYVIDDIFGKPDAESKRDNDSPPRGFPSWDVMRPANIYGHQDGLFRCPNCRDRILKPGHCHNPYCMLRKNKRAESEGE